MLYHGWFGKALGAITALIFAPEQPAAVFLAVLAGLTLGHLLDRWSRICAEKLTGGFSATRHLKRLGRTLLGSSAPQAHPYMTFTFTGLGRIAKAGGRVRRVHIRYVEDLMRQLKFQAQDRQAGIRWFHDGKDPDIDFKPLSQACAEVTADADLLCEMSLECLCLCAWATGAPDQATHDELRRLADLLGAPPGTLAEIEARVARHQGSDLATAESLRRAYAILGLSQNANLEAVKLAYRRRLSLVHPDKIPLAQKSATQGGEADDTGEPEICDPRLLAQKKTRLLRDAYELILSRGALESSTAAQARSWAGSESESESGAEAQEV